MSEKVVNPLTEADLGNVAWLCLRAAALTHVDQFLPWLGEFPRREHHARKRRFEQAQELMKKGVTELQELGLYAADCAWAAAQANYAADREAWFARFKSAEDLLRQASTPNQPTVQEA